MKMELKFSIIKNRHFEESWKILRGKAIELRQQELPLVQSCSSSDAVIASALFFSFTLIGGDTPKSINLTVYFTISQHFGTRGCQEHYQLQVQDLKFIRDPQTQQTLYVEWVEGPTKTRRGVLTKMERRLPQKLFATGDERCPVKFL